METRKRESLTHTTTTEAHKESGILEMREGVAELRSPTVNGVGGMGEPHTVLTTLPSGVEPLGGTSHFHVQLFDGQVIQITSAPLDEAETGAVKRKGCKDNVKSDEDTCVVEGEVAAGGGAVTLVTSNGKTYILPQPIGPEERTDGSYLISDGVLSAEEVIQTGTVLHEEQMLTISPPPPQPALNFNTPVTSHPDALAIATSEVFSEDYVSLPVGTRGTATTESKSFKLKTVSVEDTQEISDKIYTHTRSDTQRESSPLPDPNIITISASDTRGSSEWMEENYSTTQKIKKEDHNDKNAPKNSKETVEPSILKCKSSEAKKSIEVKIAHNEDSISYPCDYTKWVGMQSGVANNSYAVTSPPKVSSEENGEEVTSIEATEVSTDKTKSEKQKDDGGGEQPLSGDKTVNSVIQDKAKLRRSSRIRKVKKKASEVPLASCSQEENQLTDKANTLEKRSQPKIEVLAALWECDTCDAMFRTRGSRDRHVREGHAFSCYVCGWEGRSKTGYEVHISTVHCNQQARCLACRKDFPSYETYKQHMKDIHSTTSTTTTTTTTTITTTSTTTMNSTTTPSNTTVTTPATVAVKTEVECDSRLEEKVWKGEEGRTRRITEEKQGCDDSNFKDLDSHEDRGCPYCGKTFSRRSRFLRHLNYHLGNRAYVCKICAKCFVEKSGLDAHMMTHCPINMTCTECDKVFKTQRTMKRHLRTHLNRTYSCDSCGKQFRHEESLRVHKSVHKEGGSGNMCTVCEKDCKTAHYLQVHMTNKHEAAKFTCHQCERSFKWKQSYRKHMLTHHGDAPPEFICDTCPRRFVTSSELRVHQLVHTTEKKYLCDLCGNAFKHEYTRDKHVKTVHREDHKFMCPQCGSQFKAKAYLDQHVALVHTTKERVKCKYCGHDFKTNAYLRSHIKVVHKPRNPKYACKTCHKKFFAPKDLLRHNKVHTGVKDYTCPKCQRCFSRKDNMLAHFRTHTNPHHSSDDPLLVPELVVPETVIAHPAPPQASQGMPRVLSLPSSDASILPPSSSSSNIILSSVPTSSGSIVLSNVTPANSIVLPRDSSSETLTLASSSAPSNMTTISGAPITGHHVSLTSLPVASMADISNIPSSAGGIIFSTVPISSFSIASIPSTSSSVISSTGTVSNNLVYSRVQSTPNSGLSHSSSSSSSSSSSVTSVNPSISSRHSSQVASCGAHTVQQTYNLHPHIVVSSPHIPSLLTASSSVSSAVLSLPTSHSTSSPAVLMPQNSHTQMVCPTFQGEQVVLTTAPLTPVSRAAHDGSPQYTQLDPLSASISTPSTSMSASINTLSSPVSTCTTRNLNTTLATSVSLPADATHHTPSVGVPESVESNIILPTPTILQEAALILPEKSGLYTIVGEGGKIAPLETLTLHPVPPPASSHPD